MASDVVSKSPVVRFLGHLYRTRQSMHHPHILVCREGDWICRPDPTCSGPCPCPIDCVPEVCWESCDECIANPDQDYLCCTDIENCPPPSCLGGHYIEGYGKKNCTYYRPFETYVENFEICECRNVKWYCKPYPDSECEDGEWTIWFDRDNPGTTGDWETTQDLIKQFEDKMCSNPSAIQVQTLDGIPAAYNGEIFSLYSPEVRFVCQMADQPDNTCLDYEVRFCCPEQPDCDKLTKWFNTDEPREGSDADREITAVIQDEYPNEMCKNPLFIQVVVATTEQPSSSTGQVLIHHDVDPGFVCLDKEQPAGDQCHNYKVRYCCDEQPDKSGQCPMVPSIDAVRPKGYCYYECQDDTDCQGKKKCCASGICGTICMDPVFPSFHEGVIYQEGDGRKEDCNTCYCTSDGIWACTKILCGDTVIEAVELEATAERQ
ncbi:uncharacterized protein LOC100367360 [Saccoglossus kowalevskii]